MKLKTTIRKQIKSNKMATTLEIAKSLLSPPGDNIQEHIYFIGMSQGELAERMGRPKEKINDIIK
jgi:plasmid maintenance system antidote protein VapI